MCGLLGIFSEYNNGFSVKEQEALKAMMFMNQFRGRHSTGVFAIHKDLDQYTWVKNVGGPEKFWETKEAKGLDDYIFKQGKLVVAHGRHATRGSAEKVSNAHPFEVSIKKEGHIVLVHNGTLLGHQPFYQDFHKFESDSNWLTHKLAEENNPKETLSKVRGAIASIWWNSIEKKLYVYRNSERPLYCIFNNENTAFSIASEEATLAWIKYKFDYNNWDLSKMFQFNANHLYCYDLEDFNKSTQEQIIEKLSPSYVHNNYAYDGIYDSQRNHQTYKAPQTFFYSDIKSIDLLADAFAEGHVSLLQVTRESNYQYYKNNQPYATTSLNAYLPKDVYEVSLTPDKKHLQLHYNNGKTEKLFYKCLEKLTPSSSVVLLSSHSSSKKWKFEDKAKNKVYTFRAKYSPNSTMISDLKVSNGEHYKLDDKILVETYHTRELNSTRYYNKEINPYIHIFCVKVYSPDNKFIRFSIYTNKISAEQAENSIFSGTIKSIYKLQNTTELGEEFEIIVDDINIINPQEIKKATPVEETPTAAVQ